MALSIYFEENQLQRVKSVYKLFFQLKEHYTLAEMTPKAKVFHLKDRAVKHHQHLFL